MVLTDAAHMPSTPLRNAVPYEEWIGEVNGDFEWRSFDENTAAGMCYTSGTTGNPKGVLYSHRSNVLHSMIACNPDAMGVSCRDVVLPIVPMFHANCWGLALTSPMLGAALVMPGAKLDGASVYELLNEYRVTFTAGVPTVWLMLLQYLEKSDMKLPHLKKVVIGGSASPRAMTKTFQDVYGVEVCHAWGMTEMSPLGTLGSMKPEYAKLSGDARLDIQEKQGHAPFGVEMTHHRRCGQAAALGRQDLWTAQGPGRGGRPGLLQGGRGNSRPGRILRYRRCGDLGPPRLHADHRPRQGCDQVRR